MSRDSDHPCPLGNVVRLSRYRYQAAKKEDDEVVTHLSEQGALEDFEAVLHFALVRKRHEAADHPQQAS